jgi:hypothetical protein
LNTEPPSGVARRVTVRYEVLFAGFGTPAMQPSGEPVVQSRPAPVIVPAPVPVVDALSGIVLVSNFALTVFTALTRRVHAVGSPDTGEHPVQLLKTEPSCGVARSVTVVYAALFGGFGTAPVQPSADPVVQASPPPLIVPTPVPVVEAMSGIVLVSNFALTAFAALTEMVQALGSPDTAEHPVQPLNTEPSCGVARSVTVV